MPRRLRKNGAGMASEVRVVIVDDDCWKREGMGSRLDATPEVNVVASLSPDDAAEWSQDRWADIDTVVVDVYDDRAVGQVGTDLYSGIGIVERVRDLSVRCLAVTPYCAHPLVRLRLKQASPDFCYHRYQLASLDDLREAACFPNRDQRLPDLPVAEIRRLGARKLKANDLVRAYVASPLHGKLQLSTGLKQLSGLDLCRRDLNRLRETAVDLGYRYFDTLDRDRQAEYSVEQVPRWPVIRELLLHLLGRLDGPWSEYDRPWWVD
jgi:hypothetical protein